MENDIFDKDLAHAIDDAINAFNTKVPEHERRVYKEVVDLLKELKTKNGRILSTVENIRLITKLKGKMQQIVASKDYKKDVAEFIRAYEEIATLQNKYFASFVTKYRPPAVLEILKEQSIEATKGYLLQGGTQQEIIPAIDEILRANITTGGTMADLTEQLRQKITETDTPGALGKYMRQITTDSIHQYSATYTAAISQAYGFEWFEYANTLIPTSRPFCVQCRKKRWIHKSEIPTLLDGNIDGVQVAMNEKTDLPEGMIDGTTPANFIIYRGGYNCGHQLRPVPEDIVPQSAKNKLLNTDK